MINALLIAASFLVILSLVGVWIITWTHRAKSSDWHDRLTIYFPDGSNETHDCWSITYYDGGRIGYETVSGWHITSLPFIVEDHQ